MKSLNKLLGLLLFLLLAWPVASRAATTRSRAAASHTFLSLDGIIVGPVRGVTPTATGMTLKLAPGELDTAPLGAWLAGNLTGKSPGMESGAIVFTDFDSRQRRRLEFGDATLSGVDFPAFSTSSKDSVYVTLTLRVHQARSVKATGKVLSPTPAITLGHQFMMFIPGIDTSHVTWVRLSRLTPQNSSTYKLGLAMQAASFKSFKGWYESGLTKHGALVVGSSSGIAVTLHLGGLRVSRMTWSKASRTGSAALTFASVTTR